jgi:hypothetical protein
MKNAFLAAGALVASALVSACVVPGGFGGSAFKETVEMTRPLSPQGEVRLENTNGSVRVATWDEPRVRIEATKGAPSEAALRDLEVVVEGEGERVDIRSRMPRRGMFGSVGQVQYRLTVPRGASVAVRNVNGAIEVQALDGGLRARTVNGSVEATQVGGEVEAETVNGSVEVQMERVAAGSRNSLGSTNGAVRLTLPRDAAAEVEARTVNGSTRCDFDLADGGRKSRRKLEGRIGAGGARFELRTVNGSASIDRGLSTAETRTIETPREAPPGGLAPAPAR